MKAQVTLEYLALFLVFIVLFSISLGLIYSIKTSSEFALNNMKFTFQVERIDESIQNVCSLGSGNSRTITLNFPMNISYFEDGIEFENSDSSIPKSYVCDLEGDYSFRNTVLISNEDGVIILNS